MPKPAASRSSALQYRENIGIHGGPSSRETVLDAALDEDHTQSKITGLIFGYDPDYACAFAGEPAAQEVGMIFFLCFIPLFTAVDPLGNLPVFLSLTAGVPPARLNKIIIQSVITALAVAIVFVIVGKSLLHYMGISVGDFLIAGGGLMFILALKDLVASNESGQPTHDHDTLGAVPLGVPLIVGPGVLAATLVLQAQYGLWMTILATVANILITGVAFWQSRLIIRILGKAGSKAFSKITSLLLAAIAVMFIRRGIFMLMNQAG
ncbi:MAG: MarC family protein [Kiritimatiellae bacterium]|nr:MarC family protein [Kiritimatiellia bacterium]